MNFIGKNYRTWAVMAWKCITFFGSFLLLSTICASENIATTKVFIIPIGSNMFNWTTLNPNDEFEYSASLVNAPDLPKWIEYSYSKRHRTGFLYGVPPRDQENLQITKWPLPCPRACNSSKKETHNHLQIEIIGFNKMSYETRRRVIHLNILEKLHPATHEIHLKIDNVNIEDFFDSYQMNRLLDIFRFKLWKESFADLYCTFLTSAVTLGARLPLRPSEGEGVVIRLGSTAPYSSTLVELQEEVKPLWKLQQHCPRDFKKTTVERYFREKGFILDWCNFRLVDDTIPMRKTSDNLEESSQSPDLQEESLWYQPTKEQVSQRSYGGEFAFTILIPMLILIILVVLLSVIIGLHHEEMHDDSDEFFDSVFLICEDYFRSKRKSQVDEVTSSPLRGGSSLREVSQELNGGGRSRTSSPQAGLRNVATDALSRPTPPPYSGTMRTAVVDF